MAATDIKVDSIIRRSLALYGLPLHYYVPLLVIAKQGLEEMHFDTLNKLKTVQLPVSDGNQVEIPADCVEVVFAGIEIGDKVAPMGFNNTINTKDTLGEAFPANVDQYTIGQYGWGGDDLTQYDENGHYKGKNFGRVVQWTESFTINRELGIIRVDKQFEEDTILLVYLSMPEKVTNQSYIHPFASRALSEFIGWQKAVYFKEMNMIGYKRKEFYNEYRKLRGRLNKLTTVEIKRAIRKYSNLAPKG